MRFARSRILTLMIAIAALALLLWLIVDFMALDSRTIRNNLSTSLFIVPLCLFVWSLMNWLHILREPEQKGWRFLLLTTAVVISLVLVEMRRRHQLCLAWADSHAQMGAFFGARVKEWAEIDRANGNRVEAEATISGEDRPAERLAALRLSLAEAQRTQSAYERMVRHHNEARRRFLQAARRPWFPVPADPPAPR